jgi:DNA-binding transcriptional MerR regulator
MIKKLEKPNFVECLIIDEDELFDEKWEFFYSSESRKVILKKINDPSLRIDSNSFSYRLINHWEKIGLIDSARPTELGWRKYSILNLVWINIIAELRAFGLPLKKILKIKERSLLRKGKHEEFESPYTALEYYTVLALQKVPAFFLVFKSGEAHFATQNQYRLTTEFQLIGNHIKISINEIVAQFFPDSDLTPEFSTEIPVSEEELELINMIRFEKLEAINIKMKDGKIERLDAIESVNTKKRIHEILNEADYQDIEIIKADGKIVKIHRTIKKKFK